MCPHNARQALLHAPIAAATELLLHLFELAFCKRLVFLPTCVPLVGIGMWQAELHVQVPAELVAADAAATLGTTELALLFMPAIQPGAHSTLGLIY